LHSRFQLSAVGQFSKPSAVKGKLPCQDNNRPLTEPVPHHSERMRLGWIGYAHLAADPLRAANEAVGAKIAAAMSGAKGAVIPLKR
jgi:hypothetical protein